MIGIIDVGVGNVLSIKNWLDKCIVNWEIINDSENLENYSLIILPGVGSARLFMQKLKEYGLFIGLKRANERGQKILGICLGAQVFMNYLEEDGGVEGLGFIEGKVIKLPFEESNTCWSTLSFNKKNLSEDWLKNKKSTSLKTKLSGRVFFNHNYGISVLDSIAFNQLIELDSLSSFSSVVHKKNVLGFQFHPEKSQELGEILLKMIL